MFKDTIVYTDFDGNQREETHYFNLTKAEVVFLENSSVEGLFTGYLKRIVESQDNVSIMKEFENLVRASYGVKSNDGKRFIKSKEITEEFMQTEAYSEFIMKILGDADYAASFINSIMPNEEKSRQQIAPMNA